MKKYISIFAFALLLALLIPSSSKAQASLPCIPATAGSQCIVSTGNVQAPGVPGDGICISSIGSNGESQILCESGTGGGNPVINLGTGTGINVPATIVSVTCPNGLPKGYVYAPGSGPTSTPPMCNSCLESEGYAIVNGQCVGLVRPTGTGLRNATINVNVPNGTKVSIKDSVTGQNLGIYDVYNNNVVLNLSDSARNIEVTAEGYKNILPLTIDAATRPTDAIGNVGLETAATPPAQPTGFAGWFSNIWNRFINWFKKPKFDLRVGIVIVDATGTYQLTNVLGPGVVTSTHSTYINCPSTPPTTVVPKLMPSTPDCSNLGASGNATLTALINPLVEIPNATFSTWAPIGASTNMIGCTSPANPSQYEVLNCPMTTSRNIQAVYICNKDSIFTVNTVSTNNNTKNAPDPIGQCVKIPPGGHKFDLKVKAVLESPNLTYNPVVVPASTVTASGIACPQVAGVTSLTTSDCSESLSSVSLAAAPTIPNAHFVRWDNIPSDPTIGKNGCGSSSISPMSCLMTAPRDIQAVYRCDEGTTATFGPVNAAGVRVMQCDKRITQTACPHRGQNTTYCGLGLHIQRPKYGLGNYKVAVSSTPLPAITPSVNISPNTSTNCEIASGSTTTLTTPVDCGYYYSSYPRQVTLTATAPSVVGNTPATFFWSGACSGSSLTCTVTVTSSTSPDITANYSY